MGYATVINGQNLEVTPFLRWKDGKLEQMYFNYSKYVAQKKEPIWIEVEVFKEDEE